MVKKAKLDVLDIEIDKEKEPVPDEQKTEEGPYSRIVIFLRKPLLWGAVISVVLLGSIAAVTLRFYNGYNVKAPVPQSVQVASGTATVLKEEAVKEEMVILKDFIIDLRDQKDHISMVFCDLAIEPEKIQSVDTIRKHAGTRKLIYTLLKTKKVDEFILADHRVGLKTELKKDLNNLLGENTVKNIYFSRLEVI